MPISAICNNLAMFTGEDRNFADTIYQADGVTPQDITGWNFSFVIHAYGDPSTVYISKTNGSGITITNPTSGIATISVSHADTIGMNAGQYGYYIERTDPGGDIVPTYGLFTLLAK